MGRLREERVRLASWERAELTRRGYAADFRLFEAWCAELGRKSFPADSDTVSLYLTWLLSEGKKVNTARRRASAIAFTHESRGKESPVGRDARQVLIGARRERCERAEGRLALKVVDLVRVCRSIDVGAAGGMRDRAILVLGFAAGLRRSDLSRLDLSDLTFDVKGVIVRVRSSKTDQVGDGRMVGVFAGRRAATDPVRTLRAWLRARGRSAGPLFTRVRIGGNVSLDRLGPESFNQVVKRRLMDAGLQPDRYGSHSLRAGAVTASAEAGRSDREIMRMSGHTSVKVMGGYVRHAQAFAARDPLAAAL